MDLPTPRCLPSRTMAFPGWSTTAVEFYEGLEAENSKTYWLAHKETYDNLVRQPMEELLTELAPEFGAGKIFRPYRDVRFSADKSPYKTSIAATLAEGGYIQFSADGLAAGAGMYAASSDQLERFRAAVDDDRSGRSLERIVTEVRAAGITLSGHDTLKTAPRGYTKDHPRIELLRYKGLVTWQEWPAADWLDAPRAKDRVAEFFRHSAPLQGWLAEHVGPAQTSEARQR